MDAMTALGMVSNEQLEKKLKVWECDDYTWVLAANKEDANKVYLAYMHDCHGPELAGLEVGQADEFSVLTLDQMRMYRYFDDGDPCRTFLQECDLQLAKDSTTPRLFAVGE